MQDHKIHLNPNPNPCAKQDALEAAQARAESAEKLCTKATDIGHGLQERLEAADAEAANQLQQHQEAVQQLQGHLEAAEAEAANQLLQHQEAELLLQRRLEAAEGNAVACRDSAVCSGGEIPEPDVTCQPTFVFLECSVPGKTQQHVLLLPKLLTWGFPARNGN